MKYLSLVLCGILFYCVYVGKEHYKAVRHEFYQVWETIDEMRDKT